MAIFALGALVPMADEIARKLEGEGIPAAVINARFAKPIDVEMLEFLRAQRGCDLTLEDHVLRGGFGSAVLEELNNLGLYDSRGAHRLARSIHRAWQAGGAAMPSTGSAWRRRWRKCGRS